jgi:hypothetical protein
MAAIPTKASQPDQRGARAEGDELPRHASSIVLELDGVQTAWLDGLAELHGCSRENVLREALRRLSAADSARVSRTTRYQAVALAIRAERWDPVSDYLAGLEVVEP